MNSLPAFTNRFSHQQSHRQGRQQGFSFIELLLVIAIMLVLGTMSAVFYSRFLTQNAVANTVDQLTGEMRKAQIYAMMGKQNSNWAVSFSGNTITLFSTTSGAFNETFSVNPSISVTGFAQITFTRVTGLPDITPTITVSGAGTSKTLTVNSQGVVSR